MPSFSEVLLRFVSEETSLKDLLSQAFPVLRMGKNFNSSKFHC
jgi:hypothetical protein